MKLLLDTHAVLWAAVQPARLGKAARAAIEAGSNRRLVSVASFWEMSIKHAKGRLPEAEQLLAAPEMLVTLLHAELAPISVAQAIAAPRIAWDHKDPFDRLLAAQAIEQRAVLVTCDPQFGAVEELGTLW
ncbi:MAG: type II toxin-antitoxin system VapC family toxin [Bifidobacteriaceae bacterium]|jgi:PIN domain nuclease of toxin-antitoxin system|nr:type II toxin-antitoxin system VapC family toxin [Bifidobacteriaceae bacterium]